MNIHFKEIITDLSGFCYDHYQIKDFGWGELSQLNPEDYAFPMVWLNPAPSNIAGNMLELNFEMIVLDLLDQAYANKLDSMNDTLLIGNDIVSQFWDDESTYGFTLNEEGVTASPFIGDWDAFTIGWVFDISLEIPNNLNSCAIPKK